MTTEKLTNNLLKITPSENMKLVSKNKDNVYESFCFAPTTDCVLEVTLTEATEIQKEIDKKNEEAMKAYENNLL